MRCEGHTNVLSNDFARLLPELSVPWQAEEPIDPTLLVLNDGLAIDLGLDPEHLRSDEGIRWLLGADPEPGSQPVAQLYAGHQFGSYVSRLGDGRALLLGEIRDANGRAWDLHLKGSGKTPFARADGRAAVGPMLRESLMGEAMHALGVPTTRALAVIATGRRVIRDDALPGAVLTRVASSHLRIGSFQFARSTGDLALLGRLVDLAVDRHLGEDAGSLGDPGSSDASDGPQAPDRARRLLRHVIEVQADLVASWMLLGFVHGVLNTDNVTISGETIDYGPCAFIDAYDPAAVFSSIDHAGRYAFGNQPAITLWNLTRFAEMLLPLLSDDEATASEIATAELTRFSARYERAWVEGMGAKLGLAGDIGVAPVTGGEGSGSRFDLTAELAGAILGELQRHRIDFTQFFRALADAARGRRVALLDLYPSGAAPGEWLGRWLDLAPDADRMDAVNPVYIPRNHLVDEALEAASAGDLSLYERLDGVLAHPFEARPGLERYAVGAAPGSAPHRTYCGT